LLKILHNKKIKLTGTAIGEFEFLVLAISSLKILKYSAPYVPAAYFSVKQPAFLYFQYVI